MADIFYTLLNNNIGTSLEDLKWNYTIDQIHLLYEKCIKERLTSDRTQAVILANALLFTSPNYDKSGVNKASKNWAKFLDSMDWDKLITKQKQGNKPQSKDVVLNAFSSAKIPIK